MKQQTAKTPTIAIARVLRSLGLKQGSDFRVRGEYRGTGANRERIGTYVSICTNAADQIVADNADRIEELVKQDGGFAFLVSIHRTASGRVWTWIANFGQRTREGHVMDTADRGQSVPDADTAAELEEDWIARRTEEVATYWPRGTRVQGVDSYGVTCLGTVNGIGFGVVTAPYHKNYGRAWVDVTWDAMPHNKATTRRGRPFTSDLIKY